jgi:MFS family permease
MGLLEAGSMIGITVGPLVGEGVLNRIGSLPDAARFLLLGSCAVYAGCGIVRAVLLQNVPRVAPVPAVALDFPWRKLLAPAAVTLLMFVLFFLTTDGPMMSFYIKDELRGADALVQRVGFYGGLGAIAAALLTGWLADRLGAGRAMALATVTTAGLVGVLAAGLVPARLVPYLFAALFVPGEAYLVAYQKLITSLGPSERRGLAVGLVGTAVGLGASWSMALGGRLYEKGHHLPFVAAAAAGVVASLASLALCRSSFNPRS